MNSLIVKIHLLLLGFCLGFCATAGTPGPKNEENIPRQKELRVQGAYFSNIFYLQVQHAEISIFPTSSYPEPNIRLPWGGFGLFPVGNEQFLQASYAQYIKASGNLLIRYRKSSLIFPFHNFW